MKIAFYTLGCKANQFETQALEQLFRREGWDIVPFEETADVYLVNTCSVTALADKKSRNACRRAKKRNPSALLAVCGCYAQMAADALREDCGADIVVGTDQKSLLLPLILQAMPHTEIHDIWYTQRPGFDRMPAGSLEGRTRALLKVQDGCQNFCTYCIIPFARGPSRSLPLDEAVCEVRRLAAEGYREIVLTGIEISSWGADLEPKANLADLITAVCDAAPEVRIRLGSWEPRTVTEEFAARTSGCKNLCPHFHLSMQSGCDRTLKAMNRKYDTARYYESCRLLRKNFPGCAITTDLIVGFPGETAEDHGETLAFLEKCAFTQVHIFPYSKRSGTRACDLPGHLPNAVKEQRAAQAAEICTRLRQQYLDSLCGQTKQVLFETTGTGHCPEYCEVEIAETVQPGTVHTVRILETRDDRLFGVLTDQ